MKYLVLMAIASLAGIAACLPIPTPTPPLVMETSIPSTITPTPTVVWFPATPTYTPLPTVTHSITPTLDTRPQYQELIYRDDFIDPGKWIVGRIAAGSLALGINELSLVVNQPRGYLFSLNQEVNLSDYYLEISASPSICRGADEYGLLLRVSPALDFFRFGLTCDGRARVDRFLNGVASAPQPPIPHGAVPLGAPSTSRMAVWAVGKNMYFYANDEYIFSVHDPSLPTGGLGVYARAAGEDMVTVNFSNLSIYAAR